MERKLLQLLTNCLNKKHLQQTHVQIIINGLQDSIFIIPKLISLSNELISLHYAKTVFKDTILKQTLNVVSYNIMIKCYIGNGYKKALGVYNQMRGFEILPNSFTFTFLMKCIDSELGSVNGCCLHCHVVKFGFDSSVFTQNAFLDFYARCTEALELACKLFDEMSERDVVSWNSLNGAYMVNGDVKSAIRLFEEMPERNVVTWNSLICGLSMDGVIMELARSLFEKMPERNDFSWNSMISGYVREE